MSKLCRFWCLPQTAGGGCLGVRSATAVRADATRRVGDAVTSRSDVRAVTSSARLDACPDRDLLQRAEHISVRELPSMQTLFALSASAVAFENAAPRSGQCGRPPGELCARLVASTAMK